MNGNYLEWKTINVENSDDETVRTPVVRNDRRIGESKSLPSSSNSSSTATPPGSTGGTETHKSSVIKFEIVNAKTETEPDRGSFASNTIKRYSRFRAKQEKKEKPTAKSRPKSLDHHIYVNLESTVDKNTLVQHWINRTQSDISEITKQDAEVSKVHCGTRCKSNSDGKDPVQSLEDDDVPLELRCPVCLDLYQKPLFLPCGHTYCKGCIQKVVDSSDRETKRKQRFVCPTCRNIIKYGNEGIDALPKNINLEFAVKRYETGHGVKAPMCQSHIKYRQEKVIWCEDCNVCICPLCIFDGNHKEHQVAPVNVMTEIQQVRKKLKKTKMVLAGRVDDLQKSLVLMEKHRDGMDSKTVDMKKKIDKECQSMIALIKKQHQDMYTQMESAMAKKQKRKQKQIATIANDIDRTNSILTEIQNILDTDQPTVFLEKVKMSKVIAAECPSLSSKSSKGSKSSKTAAGTATATITTTTTPPGATPPPRPMKLPAIKDQTKVALK